MAERDRIDTERAMKKKEERSVCLDTIRGSLIGGAAGDALGYPVEFMSLSQIKRAYGGNGIEEYDPDPVTGKALISDDTQMTLFTATAILVGDTRIKTSGIAASLEVYAWRSYKGWFRTQQKRFGESDERNYSWLEDVPELYARRAPGMTCLSALSEERYGTVREHINNSKGCGGVMRVAPVGLFFGPDYKMIGKEGAAVAAITHGHPLGYLPAAVMTQIVNQITYHRDEFEGLKSIVTDAQRTVAEIFPEEKDMEYLNELIDRAIDLSENDEPDEDNIPKLGEGWVAEETLAIAIYCALRHQDDFSAGIIAAVNHDGDSDSTGAVAGNILGAWVGYNAIDDKWKKDLEIEDVILEVADDLCQGCLMEEFSSYRDPAWMSKYMDMKRYDKSGKEDRQMLIQLQLEEEKERV